MRFLTFIICAMVAGVAAACVPDGETTTERIKRHEGFVSCVYKDIYGNHTIGWGHLLSKPVDSFMCWDEKYADAVLAHDIAYSATTAAHDFGSSYPLLPAVPASVLTELAFWIGGAGLAQFTDFLRFMRQGDYAGAANDLDGTLLASQVPARAGELSCLLRG